MEEKTLEYYEYYAEEFFNNTVNADVSKLYKIFLDRIPEGCKILDLGCGSGRDSKYFIEKGYKVVSIDGCRRLCELASEYVEQEVFCKRFEKLDYQEEFEGIWACASLLHVEGKNMKRVLRQVRNALVPGGILYASYKLGTGERISRGRYFKNYTEETLRELFDKKEWENQRYFVTQDVRENREEELWINVIVQKHSMLIEPDI